jgi:predicted nuclease of predicted toxin-antitoxin system
MLDLLRATTLSYSITTKRAGFVVVTTDADFFELVTMFGPPPKVVRLRRWSHHTSDAELLLKRNAIRLAAFESDPDEGILILDRESAS